MAPNPKHNWSPDRTTFVIPSDTYSDLKAAAKGEAARRRRAAYISAPDRSRSDYAQTVVFYDPPSRCPHCDTPGPKDTGYMVYRCEWCASLIFVPPPPERICLRCLGAAHDLPGADPCPRPELPL